MSNDQRDEVLFLTQFYWPEMIGSGPYCADMAEWLARSGSAVQVFTCRPHYPEGVVEPEYRDGGHDRQQHNGVDITRVDPFLPKRRGALNRILTEAWYLTQGMTRLVQGSLRRSDSVVSLCPSMLTVLLGILATRRGGHHVTIVHDIQSGLASGLGMVRSGILVKAMRLAERIILNRVDRILVLSENMRRHLAANGIRTPIDILPLWVDTDRFHPREQPPSEKLTVLYSGNFGKKQALSQVLDMAARLERDHEDIAILMRGDGSETQSLWQQASAEFLDNVHFAPLVRPERLDDGLAEGAIHLVPQDGNAADFAVPSKLYAIMAAGRPIVATARPGSLLWQLMEKSDALFCVPAGDVAALTESVKRLAHDAELRRNLGRNGRSFVMKNHRKNVILDHFVHGLRARGQYPTGQVRHATASADI